MILGSKKCFPEKKKKNEENILRNIHYLTLVLLQMFNLYHFQGKYNRWQTGDIFLFFPENRMRHFKQVVSNGDNLLEMSNPVFWKNKKNISICHLMKILPSAMH